MTLVSVQRRVHLDAGSKPRPARSFRVAAVQAAEARSPRVRGARHCALVERPFINLPTDPAL